MLTTPSSTASNRTMVSCESKELVRRYQSQKLATATNEWPV